MGKFDAYQVDLKKINPAEAREYNYLLDNKFFMDIDGTEVQKGKVNVTLNIERRSASFEMDFHITGFVIVSCDRCLDDMELPIDANNRLIVKYGKEYAEESDEILIISEEEGPLNLAWFLYEFVALAIPIKRIHAAGKCNKAMATKLRKYAVKQPDDEAFMYGTEDMSGEDDTENRATDPRWDALKNLNLEGEN